MLDWNEIIGINKDMNYMGNVENGVILPELDEEVIFCRHGYRDDTQDIYFSGCIFESKYGLELTNSCINGTEMVADGIKWARFNKPETENNIGYAIAYLDENDNGFKKDIPNIVKIEKDEINEKIGILNRNGYSKITVFKYIKPCTFQYNWDYVNSHKVIH